MTAGGAGEAHAFGMAGLWTGDDAARAERRRQLRRRQRPPAPGWGAAPSIDQIVAQASGPNMPYQRAANDADARRRAIDRSRSACSAAARTSLNRMTYTGANAPIHPEVNPKAAFDRSSWASARRDDAADRGPGGHARAQRAEGDRRPPEGRPRRASARGSAPPTTRRSTRTSKACWRSSAAWCRRRTTGGRRRARSRPRRRP